jgi:hypothetical protein
MPSLTYWNRLEPRPRATSIAPSLAARVRDPLWMLTRQWQVGEFKGEDTGSPAFSQVSARLGSIFGWRGDDGELHPVTPENPVEDVVESEPFAPGLAMRVELGQIATSLFADESVPKPVIDSFRRAYLVAPVSDAELASRADQESARFLRVCGGRVLDGIALYNAARSSLPNLPSKPSVPGGIKDAVLTALTAFVEWVEEVLGAPGTDDPSSWAPDRLEYRLELVAASPDGTPLVLAVNPGRDGDFDWDALDLRPDATAAVPVPDGSIQTLSTSVLPANVRFRGMPNARWWAFESETTDFGSVTPDKRDLGKLVVLDFMLIHGNGWFVMPFDLPVGSVGRIDTFIVHDVFGVMTLVESADKGGESLDERWALFSSEVEGKPTEASGFFVLPPSASAATQNGAAIEDIRFFRDEMANMVWAIEHSTENELGQPWPGHERDLANKAGATVPPTSTADSTDPLRYVIQTEVPEHWIPFLGVVIDPGKRDIALQRSAMLRPKPDGSLEPVEPLGRVLRPTKLGDDAYRIPEEEVPRSGVRVSRVVCRSRWTDGSTHIWISRRKSVGAGEGASGLRFDLAVTSGS